MLVEDAKETNYLLMVEIAGKAYAVLKKLLLYKRPIR
jgi:hypothetical protein